MNSITLNNKGIELSYSDSGAPAQGPYTTVVAVHGMGFTYAIFTKVQAIAPRANFRFIAVVRRGYEGSTPFSEADTAATTSGTDEEKLDFLNARGIEFAISIDKLVQQLDLLQITEDGKSGGVALLGWSAGTMVTLASIANLGKLSPASKTRFAAYVRAHIMEEPPSVCLGLPIPPRIWSPLIDTSIPESERTPFHMSWITSYFDHGDLSSHDIDAISYAAPSMHHAPSIYNMSTEDTEELFVADVVGPETNAMIATYAQNNVVYRKACYEPAIQELLPMMNTSVLVGSSTSSFCMNGLLSLQNDNDVNQGGLHFETVPGLNHFMQWDEPEKTFRIFMKLALL
ncbi:uncharacterized protein FOMMEDRAFT_160017 [Fomitiporia mediterranea MF3/22]|uniref:uncharacterized protein n=1 Tax=Fomitiporia mediterranea (strain MF3/22) TaxID=694068 RepID=UPI00044085D7|nr:uncharacterized protein FOMMEDRAFT_160017 [Fomitiporia mediterranea MF3/22]EJC99595.1 hypothetical protein FOMMEDRAFT_160017 [Fomitiporia mediterranea MF3/22]